MAPGSPMQKIMVVEDDLNLGPSLKKYLMSEGYLCTLVVDLKSAREEDANLYQLIVLDWMLPDGQGIDFLQELKVKKTSTPVILLTARADLIDKVLGLEAGASDYLTKPFEPRELMARIRVQLRQQVFLQDLKEGRRSEGSGEGNGPLNRERPQNVTEVEGVKIFKDQREVYFQDVKIEFTKMEYDLLSLFAENPNKVFSREEILNKVWGLDNYPTTRTVDTHVLQLRQKLREDLIETVRGIGYRLISHL
jgi:DNA-binding response OmpR family regulator